MTATVPPLRIGKFEFRVAASKTKSRPAQRVDTLKNWLLSEWYRQQEKPREQTANRG